MPDPLADGARARALAPLSLRLQQTHLHSAASAAVTAGIPLDKITSLASLIEPETFRTLMRQLWRKDGRKLSAFTHGVGVTLIAIASEWVKASPDVVATLKELRSKLGTLPIGLTEKNEALLRKFDDPRLLVDLVQLPDRAVARGAARSGDLEAVVHRRAECSRHRPSSSLWAAHAELMLPPFRQAFALAAGAPQASTTHIQGRRNEE